MANNVTVSEKILRWLQKFGTKVGGSLMLVGGLLCAIHLYELGSAPVLVGVGFMFGGLFATNGK